MAFRIDPRRLGLSRRTGRKLPVAVRRQMSAAFATDFSAVRVHEGPQPERLGTIAFAAGADIYFSPGHYDPATEEGLLLLGHELAHVVQQQSWNERRQSRFPHVVLVQDRQLEEEADQMAIGAALRRPVLSPRTAWPRTARRLPRNSLIIQPWTPAPSPLSHQPNQLSRDPYKSCEILSNKKGEESDTGNFTHHTGSDWLDSCTGTLKCYYNQIEIGTLRTVTEGSEKVKPLVKMHLVNSFLHGNANTWQDNWFWGSHDLNKQHNVHEEEAKKFHPATDEKKAEGQKIGSLLLQYETSVVAEKKPTASTLEQFKTQLTNKITKMRNAAAMSYQLDTTAIPDSQFITIGEPRMTVTTFYGLWTAAISKTAYAKVKVKFRYHTTTGWKGDYEKFAEYNDTYQIDIIEGTTKRKVGNVWAELFPPAAVEGRSKRSKLT